LLIRACFFKRSMIPGTVQPPPAFELRVASFSLRGPIAGNLQNLTKPDVTAPGVNIYAAFIAAYGTLSGTSMASPHVAGVLALMKSAHPGWTPAQLIAALRREADDKACSAATAGAVCVGPEADNSYFGEGMVDALDAVS
jgi:subtilisin family serine protease